MSKVLDKIAEDLYSDSWRVISKEQHAEHFKCKYAERLLDGLLEWMKGSIDYTNDDDAYNVSFEIMVHIEKSPLYNDYSNRTIHVTQ